MKVKVYPCRKGMNYGNIIWAERDKGSSYYPVSRFAARAGKFPSDHPVGGTTMDGGSGENIKRFRELGYWASCFPEGDGMSWEPLKEQSHEQCLEDIKAAFGWDIEN